MAKRIIGLVNLGEDANLGGVLLVIVEMIKMKEKEKVDMALILVQQWAYLCFYWQMEVE